MSDVFYLRPTGQRASAEDVIAMVEEAGGCFNLHRVTWKRSFLATDGGRMLCWYQAPDAESARIALRDMGADTSLVWSGSIAPGEAGLFEAEIDALLEVEFAEPVTPGQMTAMFADVLPRAELCAGILALDGLRAIGLYSGLSAELPEPASLLTATTMQLWPCAGVTPPAAQA